MTTTNVTVQPVMVRDLGSTGQVPTKQADGTFAMATPVVGINPGGTPADGDLAIYDSGSGGWVLLPAGTTGQVLTMGSGGLPEWQTP